MSNKKMTKRALMTSVLAIVMCLVMLIGSTFAWFTDTASTGVNKITAGNLHVQIQNEKGDSIDTLEWVKENGDVIANQESILWEPGCTYLLTPFKIVNTGNLALKYKIVITGLDGDSKLLDVIKFTYKTADGTEFDMSKEGHLTASGTDGAATKMITVSAHMDEAAGNTYMDKELNNVRFTVYATQDTVENDSYGNTYDKMAEYPIAASGNVTVGTDGKVENEVTIVSAEKTEDGDHVAKAVIPVGAKAETTEITQMTLSVTNAAKPANLTITSNQSSHTLEVKMIGLSEDNTELIKVALFVGKNLNGFELYHHDAKMNAQTELTAVAGNQDYYYDETTGIVTFLTDKFSPFTCVYNKGNWSDAEGEYETPVDTAKKVVTIATAEELALFAKQVTDEGVNYSGYTVNITNNIDLGANFWKPIKGNGKMSGITINGNGHTISNMTVRDRTNSSGYGTGFIGDTNGSITIKNITFTNANVTFGFNSYWGNIGGIVMGYTYGTTLFENVTVTNSTIWGYGKIGCLLGMGADPGVSVTFKNCVSRNNTINAAYDMGGLAGMIQRGNGVDNGNVENCTVENITVNYESDSNYVDVKGTATFKTNDEPSGTDYSKEIDAKYLDESGYYWCGYADYYVSYGHSSYDAPVEGYSKCLANSEYPVNK